MLPTGWRDFADGTGVMGLEKGEDPGLLGGPNVITWVLKGGDPFPAESETRRRNSKPGRDLTRISWWRKGNMRECGWSLEAGPALSLQPAKDRDFRPTTAKSWILPTPQWARKRTSPRACRNTAHRPLDYWLRTYRPIRRLQQGQKRNIQV